MGALKHVLVFLFMGSLLSGTDQDYETIAWKKGHKLQWADFKGDVPRNPKAAAVTASGITYQFYTLPDRPVVELDFKVDAHFYPQKSWYQKKRADSIILSHEQLHFDISELFARKMRERLQKTDFTKNVKAEVQAIYKEILKDLGDFQHTYDLETNYSRDHGQQLSWNKKIAALLK